MRRQRRICFRARQLHGQAGRAGHRRPRRPPLHAVGRQVNKTGDVARFDSSRRPIQTVLDAGRNDKQVGALELSAVAA